MNESKAGKKGTEIIMIIRKVKNLPYSNKVEDKMRKKQDKMN